ILTVFLTFALPISPLICYLLVLTSLLVPLFHGTTSGLFCLVQSFISFILGLGSVLHDCLARSLRVVLRSIQPVAGIVVDKAACGVEIGRASCRERVEVEGGGCAGKERAE